MTLTGQIEEIFPEKQITEKFAIREFVLKIDGQYPESILFQCANQTIKLLDSFMAGEMVTVHFIISGRKAKDRYWNSLKVFKIEGLGNIEERETVKPAIEEKSATEKYFDKNPTTVSDDSGLPF